MNSILNSTKKVLGIMPQYEHYDDQLIYLVNSIFSILHQYGVGGEEGFAISDASTTWEELLGDDPRLNMVKSFVHMKARYIFDPPSNASATEALGKCINELESRIIYMTDHIEKEGSE